MQHRYIFRVDPELSDALSGCLFSAGAEGLEDRGTSLVAYADRELGQELTEAYEDFRRHIAVALPELLPPPVEVEEVDSTQATAWLKNLPAVLLTDGIWFCPISRRADPPASKDILWFEPRVAFGSGEHPTTRLASRALAEIARETATGDLDVLLDVGTGSGVLGLLALRLGWQRVVGTDIQLEAIEAAQENASLNGFGSRFLVHLGSFPERASAEDGSEDETETYRWVVANIDRGTLLELSPEFSAKLRHGGTLLLTGLLVEDMEEVTEAYIAQGLDPAGSATEGEWGLLRFTQRSS